MKPFFVFSGQGAQVPGMGHDLYEKESAARAVFEEADRVLGIPLSQLIFTGSAEELTATRNCQIAIYTMSCAALEAFRVRFPQILPVACAGLSLGEYAALYAGGAFSFADGLKLLKKRAELMESCCQATSGTMATALGGDPAVIEEVCKVCDVDVANYNSPGQIVISGESAKVGAAVAELKARGMRKVVELKVAGAFHSRLMEEAAKGLEAVLKTTAVTMPQIPVYQNFSGAVPADAAELKANLSRQVSGSVRWESCVRAAFAAGADCMIEFGPGSVLTGLLRRTIPDTPFYNINSADFPAF